MGPEGPTSESPAGPLSPEEPGSPGEPVYTQLDILETWLIMTPSIWKCSHSYTSTYSLFFNNLVLILIGYSSVLIFNEQLQCRDTSSHWSQIFCNTCSSSMLEETMEAMCSRVRNQSNIIVSGH